MSIASELEDAIQALADAKAVVVEKGGTVGDTGLVGLCDEISSIPTGGGTLENYGTLKYLDSNDVEQSVVIATDYDFEELTLGNAIGTAVFTINNTQVPQNKITEIEISEGVAYLPDNILSGCPALTKITLPDSIEYIGNRVFNSNTSFNAPLNLKNVKRVGQYFLYSSNVYNQPTSLPKVEYIDSYFMNGQNAFNSPLTINDNCMVIGSRFLNNCGLFAQPFAIPSGLITNLMNQNPGDYFMYNCSSFTGPLTCNAPSDSAKIPTSNAVLTTNQSASSPMYATGVTLTGPYASAWKNALPDRDTSPYRKLILGS